MRLCTVKGCGRIHYAHDVCQLHYGRLMKYGDPLGSAPPRQPVTADLPERDLAWAAGIFEGEGTVRIRNVTARNKAALIVSLVSTDKQIIDWLQARWPGCMKFAARKPPHRDAWVWVTAAWKAAGFLQQIRPYVVRDMVKERIRVAMDFQEGKKLNARWLSEEERDKYIEEQWTAWMYMAHLNQRGRPHGSKSNG